MEEKKEISSGLAVFNVVLAFLVIAMLFVIGQTGKHTETVTATSTSSATVHTHAFDSISLQAKSAYVYDALTGQVLFAKAATVERPLASLTKLMMAVTAVSLLPQDSHITIRKEFLTTEGDNGLLPGESWKLKDLLDFSLVVSSNDGARSIASVIGATLADTSDYDMGRRDFIEKMNQKAQKLGLSDMYFINENGLDEDSVSGGYGSAASVAKLMQYILSSQPALLEATKYPVTTISSLQKNHTAKNTDTAIANIPGLIASKTGYTSLAGGNLAVAFDAGLQHPIIVVVLDSTESGRFTDVTQLVKASLAALKDN